MNKKTNENIKTVSKNLKRNGGVNEISQFEAIKNCSFSVKPEVHGAYIKFLEEVNGVAPEYKKDLAKLTINDVLEILKPKLDKKFKSQLLSKRVTGTVKLRLLKKRYEEKVGNISEDIWNDFVISGEFQKFKKENIDCLNIF